MTVAPQYDTTHVYVAPEDFDRFVASLVATFGGHIQTGRLHRDANSEQHHVPVGADSRRNPVGFRVQDAGSVSVRRRANGLPRDRFDAAVQAARATSADVVVAPFNDPIGRDAIIQWPGGVNTQLYWHTTAPSYKALQTIPENRIYVSADRGAAFVASYVAFSHGRVVSDNGHAPGIEIGEPGETYRRIRIESGFGKLVVFVTDGHLPYPYGREITGYEVPNLIDTLTKAKAAGVEILVAPYTADQRSSAIVQFPGGYISEIHSITGKPN